MAHRRSIKRTAVFEPDDEQSSDRSRKPASWREESADDRRERYVETLHRTVGNQAIKNAYEANHSDDQAAVNRDNDVTDGQAARVDGRSGRGRAVQSLHRRGLSQVNLTVSSSDDSSEQEAERVADAVIRTADPEPALDADEKISRKQSSNGMAVVAGDHEENIRSLVGGGQPLTTETRTYFEPRFGRDFGDVRVHTGPKADEAAQSIGAEAFVMGSDVAFASGNYRPNTREGKRLLAHELTHVVQQQYRPNTRGSLNDSTLLREASPREGSGIRASSPKGSATTGPREQGTVLEAKKDEKKKELRTKADIAEDRQKIIKEAVKAGNSCINAYEEHYDELIANFEQAYKRHYNTIEDAREWAKTRAAIINTALGVAAGMAIGPIAGSLAGALSRGALRTSSVVINSTIKGLSNQLLSLAGTALVTEDLKEEVPSFESSPVFNTGYGKTRALQNLSYLNKKFREAAMLLTTPDVDSFYRKLYIRLDENEITPTEINAFGPLLDLIETAHWEMFTVALTIQHNFILLQSEVEWIPVPDPDSIERQIWVIWIANLPRSQDLLPWQEKMINERDLVPIEGPHRVLDEKPIEDRLDEIGVIGERSLLGVDFGDIWTSSSDTANAWRAAKEEEARAAELISIWFVDMGEAFRSRSDSGS